MTLLLHCGGIHASINDLREVPLPLETDTYKPVSHYALAHNLAELSDAMLSGFSLSDSRFGLARDGKQMFGVHTFRNSSDQMGLSIGFRNSYDKSMSVGIAIGATVFVCDNLALTGEVTVMRKHTLNVWDDLETMALKTIFGSRGNFNCIQQDASVLSSHDITDDEAYRLIGFLYGHGVLSPRQLPIAKKEWHQPSYDDFSARNAWSFYNACTEALKSSPPRSIMEKHIQLHQMMMKGVRYE